MSQIASYLVLLQMFMLTIPFKYKHRVNVKHIYRCCYIPVQSGHHGRRPLHFYSRGLLFWKVSPGEREREREEGKEEVKGERERGETREDRVKKRGQSGEGAEDRGKKKRTTKI